MGKIISILKFKKAELPLTGLMIKTLRAAFKMQSNNEPFGQADLDGSFTALVRRELIDTKITTVLGKQEVLWYVTAEGINSLNKLGFTEPC